MADHPNYRICGPVIDRYLNDPDTTPPEQLETGVLFPIEKI
jgi:effector-binding domain-containing protein